MGEDHVQRRRTHWWNRRRRCRMGNQCRRATSRNVTHHSFHPRERRWRRNYLPARPKRRIRKAQRTAYQLKIAALRKQLDQDVPVTCWSDRIREEPDGTLAVSFGSGISKPRTISIASLNIQVCKHLEEVKEQRKKKGADRLELQVEDFKKDRREVLLLQHTGAL